MRFRPAAVLDLLFVATVGAILLVPAIGLVINTTNSAVPLRALLPEEPSPAGLAALPKRLDEHIATHYGNRDELIEADAAVKAALGGESRRVAFGSDGFLFLKDDDVFSQVTGQRIDRARLANVAALATMMAEKYGNHFVFMVAPNKHTIYRNRLPAWARKEPPVSERTLLMDILAARGVNAVDPTPALLARAESASVYWRSDTHWTPYGTIIAFDALAEALGMPEQKIDVDTVYSGQTPVEQSGDLLRIAGLGETWPEMAPKRIGPDPFDASGLIGEDFPPGVETGGHMLRHRDARTGPKVLVLGDSFTVGLFARLLMRFAGEVLWLHHRTGRFDPRLVDEFDPDIVILAVVERHLASFGAAATK